MEEMAPLGKVYQAGTLSGNPLAMSAGLATLELLSDRGAYEELEEKAGYLAEGLRQASTAAEVPVFLNRVGSMGCGFFADEPVADFAGAMDAKAEVYAVFFQEMLKRGVYLAPSQFEAFFISLAHDRVDLDRTIEAASEAFARAKEKWQATG